MGRSWNEGEVSYFSKGGGFERDRTHGSNPPTPTSFQLHGRGGRGEGVGGFDKLRRAWRRRLGLWPHGDKSQWWRSGGGGGVWGCTTVVQKEGGIATERGREGQSTAFSFWERIGGGRWGGRSDSHENRVPQLMEAIKAPPTPKPMPRRRRQRPSFFGSIYHRLIGSEECGRRQRRSAKVRDHLNLSRNSVS